ncbi:MAG: DUF6916 family protein [Frankiaceae bacterium]
MTELGALTAEDFDPLVGTEFRRVAGDGHDIVLRLVEVRRRERRSGEREVFVLLLRSQGETCLAHDTHPLSHETLGELAIFLGPVARTGDGFEYEAVFA